MQQTLKRYVRQLCLLLLLLALGAQSSTLADEALGDRVRRRVANDAAKCLSKKAFVYGVDFSRSRALITDRWESIAAAQTPHELARSISDVLGAFGVSHLNILSPTEMMRRAEGEDLWPGMRMVPARAAFLVSLVVPDGPADLAGLRRGDRVTAIDGVPASEASEAIRGARLVRGLKSTRRVRWERDGETHEAEVGFDRTPPGLPGTLRWKGEYAWLSLNTFRKEVYDREVIDACFEEIHARQAKGLIVDLRSNGGGRLSNVLHLLSWLLPAGETVAWVIEEPPKILPGRTPPDAPTPEMAEPLKLPESSEADPFKGPVVVLIDRAAGSGGDLVPAVLQDHRGARLIGMRTAGALLAGSWCKLSAGYGLVYPTAEMLRPSGARVEGVGVQPDVPLSPEQTVDDDAILGVALRQLARFPRPEQRGQVSF